MPCESQLQFLCLAYRAEESVARLFKHFCLNQSGNDENDTCLANVVLSKILEECQEKQKLHKLSEIHNDYNQKVIFQHFTGKIKKRIDLDRLDVVCFDDMLCNIDVFPTCILKDNGNKCKACGEMSSKESPLCCCECLTCFTCPREEPCHNESLRSALTIIINIKTKSIELKSSDYKRIENSDPAETNVLGYEYWSVLVSKFISAIKVVNKRYNSLNFVEKDKDDDYLEVVLQRGSELFISFYEVDFLRLFQRGWKVCVLQKPEVRMLQVHLRIQDNRSYLSKLGNMYLRTPKKHSYFASDLELMTPVLRSYERRVTNMINTEFCLKSNKGVYKLFGRDYKPLPPRQNCPTSIRMHFRYNFHGHVPHEYTNLYSTECEDVRMPFKNKLESLIAENLNTAYHMTCTQWKLSPDNFRLTYETYNGMQTVWSQADRQQIQDIVHSFCERDSTYLQDLFQKHPLRSIEAIFPPPKVFRQRPIFTMQIRIHAVSYVEPFDRLLPVLKEALENYTLRDIFEEIPSRKSDIVAWDSEDEDVEYQDQT